MRLEAAPVTTDEDVDMLRRIRNACRGTFAYNNLEIDETAQKAWWVAMQGRIHAWLYAADDEVIGYGLIREEDGRWWDSVAVMPHVRGFGYGSEICSDLAQRAGCQVWSKVRPGNFAARRMHRDSDWELLGVEDGMAQYRSRVGVTSER